MALTILLFASLTCAMPVRNNRNGTIVFDPQECSYILRKVRQSQKTSPLGKLCPRSNVYLEEILENSARLGITLSSWLTYERRGPSLLVCCFGIKQLSVMPSQIINSTCSLNLLNCILSKCKVAAHPTNLVSLISWGLGRAMEATESNSFDYFNEAAHQTTLPTLACFNPGGRGG